MQDLGKRSLVFHRFLSYIRSPLHEDDDGDDILSGYNTVSASEPDLSGRL